MVAAYEATNITVRSDLVGAHQRAWTRLDRAGTWLDGRQRLAVAAEARRVRCCQLCTTRKAALSPSAVDGVHDGGGTLSAAWTEVVHRIVSDRGRLTHGW